MTIDFEDESGISLGIPLEEIADQVVNAAVDYMSCPFEVQVNLLITNDQEIHQMNLQHRGIDRPTDVLSFPMIEYAQAGDFQFLEQAGMDYFHPETGELLLGDIVISADKVIAQAEEYGHSIKREYAFLIAHSMLHLMGFDHMQPEEAAEMEKLQDEILNSINITRQEVAL